VNCPTDSTNLVWRAAEALWKAAGRRGSPRDVAITLVKRIPVAAGLGGGSSDAAAVLRALARMWRVEAERLPAIAAALGADVSYFLEGGTVLGLERGDLLFPLQDRPQTWVTLVVPAFTIRTSDAYRWFDADAKRLRRRLKREDAVNDLEAPVATRHPEIARLVGALRRAGASHAAMTGSGSAVFGLFDRRRAAARAANLVATLEAREALTPRTIVTRTLSRAQYRRLAGK